MEIVVCVKHVPKTTEEELSINKEGTDIEKEDLVFDINEPDHYAVEEAIRLKENFGGKVTVVTVGNEQSAETLRKALGMGADSAVLILDEQLPEYDCFITAHLLSLVIKSLPYDLILTGVQSDDDSSSQVGVSLAEILGIPHATVVNHLKIMEKKAEVQRELEGNINEFLEIDLPALFAIQTGINEPRYVSIMGIKKASEKEIKKIFSKDLLDKAPISPKTSVKRMYIPEVISKAVIFKGTPEETSVQLANLIKEKAG